MNPQCQECRLVIPEFFSGSLSLQQSQAVTRHIEHCPDCRRYFDAFERDDERLSRLVETLQPVAKAVESSVIASISRRADKSWLHARWLKLAAAAAIVLAVLGIVERTLSPRGVSSLVLAETLRAMQDQPWVHSIVEERVQKRVGRYEHWEQYALRIQASRAPDGVARYVNTGQNVAYSYDPSPNTITVSLASDPSLSQSKTPVEMVSDLVAWTQRGGTETHVQKAATGYPHAQVVRIDFTGNPVVQSATLTRDAQRNLLTQMEQVVARGAEERSVTIRFDYPASGPKDIFSLGVPANAVVRDLRPGSVTTGRVLEANETRSEGPAPVPDSNVAMTAETRLQEEPAAAAPAESATQGMVGTVRNEQGNAIADATVLLFHKRSEWGLGDEVVQTVTTDPNGFYRLTSPVKFERTEPHEYAQDSYILFALHPDYALAWQNIRQGQVKLVYDLTVTSPTTRTITVTDMAGNPLPGTRVWLYGAGDQTSSNPLFRSYLSVATDVGLIGSVTDANGCAVIRNVPATDCSFHATLEGYARGLAFSRQSQIRLSLGANVSGWVMTDKGALVSGAVVSFYTDWDMNQYFLVETDDSGHFEVRDLPAAGWDMSPWGESWVASGAYRISVKHPNYAAADRNLLLEPGQEINDLMIEVASETTLVKCVVVEEGTERVVPGARIYGQNEIGRINGYSDANGVFTVRVIQGPTSLSFSSPPNGVYVLGDTPGDGSRVQLEAQGPEMTVVVRSPAIAGRLVNVRGVVLGPQRMPSANAVVRAAAGRFETATSGGYIRPTGTDAQGRFELKEVPCGRDLHLYAETKDHALAATSVVAIPAEPNDVRPLELVLQSTRSIATVIYDQQGKLAADTSLSFAPIVEGDRMSQTARNGKTDSSGVLETDGIIPGLTYYLRDAKWDNTRGPRPDGHDKWLQREIVLLPLKP